MDWSRANIGGAGIQVTVSDFKLYDADGKEIEQLGFEEYGKETVETPEPAVEEESTETTAPEETVPAETESEKSDDKTIGEEAEPEKPIETPVEENAKTGEEAPVVALAALAASSAFIAFKSRKK